LVALEDLRILVGGELGELFDKVAVEGPKSSGRSGAPETEHPSLASEMR
jgi:hypothetical protein